MTTTQSLAAGLLTLAALHSPAFAQSPADVRVGTSGTANTVLAIWMADDAGLYAKHNLKVTLSNMGGGSRGAAEVRAGKLDVMHVGLSSVVQLNQTGADLRTIASLANIIRFGFFTVPAVKSAAGAQGRHRRDQRRRLGERRGRHHCARTAEADP